MAGLRVKAALRGNLTELLEAERQTIVEAKKTATTQSAINLKLDLRREVLANLRGRGLGRLGSNPNRAANAVRHKVFADGNALVWSKFGRKLPGRGFVDFLGAFTGNQTIRPRNGKLLFVPRDPAVRRALPSVQRTLIEEKGVRLIKLGGGGFMIVKETRSRGKILAFLLPKVRLRARFRFDPIVTRAGDGLVERFTAALDRE